MIIRGRGRLLVNSQVRDVGSEKLLLVAFLVNNAIHSLLQEVAGSGPVGNVLKINKEQRIEGIPGSEKPAREKDLKRSD